MHQPPVPRPDQSPPGATWGAFARFVHSEVGGSIILLASTGLALAWANSPWRDTYAHELYGWFGADLTVVALGLIAAIGLLSSLLANIPVVAASIMMVKGYLVAAAVAPEAALGAHFADWPTSAIPVFVAMMFGATLGGNATLIGASANVVTAGICARNGKRVTFAGWLRYGLPITACQLAVSALYVLALLRSTR